MNYEVVTLKQKSLVGVQTKTSNNDSKAGEKIGQLWSDFMSPAVYQSIKKTATNRPICLYSDYENPKETGENLRYQVTIGFEVIEKNEIEQPLVSKTIPTGKYAKFFVKGDVATATMNAWATIWQMSLDRTYTGDFEEYLNESMDEAEINIYVAIK